MWLPRAKGRGCQAWTVSDASEGHREGVGLPGAKSLILEFLKNFLFRSNFSLGKRLQNHAQDSGWPSASFSSQKWGVSVSCAPPPKSPLADVRCLKTPTTVDLSNYSWFVKVLINGHLLPASLGGSCTPSVDRAPDSGLTRESPVIPLTPVSGPRTPCCRNRHITVITVILGQHLRPFCDAILSRALAGCFTGCPQCGSVGSASDGPQSGYASGAGTPRKT